MFHRPLAQLVLLLFASTPALAEPPPTPTAAAGSAFEVEVAGLPSGSTIPTTYTCDGADRSPTVKWAAGASPARSYALIVDDHDAPAGTWVHWLAWNIPITVTQLYEHTRPSDRGLVQGLTDFKQIGWGGPCPPRGNGTHRYYFRMYALSVVLDLDTGADRKTLDAAMQGHIVATGEWMGRYTRRE